MNDATKATKSKQKATKFRKSSHAPRRFKSAFIFFSQAKHSEIRERFKKDGVEVTTPEVAKIVSKEWRSISPEEKATWEEKAVNDKMRYEAEKQIFTGPWKVPALRRAKKDPTAPKRPMSAFLAYSKAKRNEVKLEHPRLHNTQLSKILAVMWKNAPEDERNEYKKSEEEKRIVYKEDMDKWRTEKKEALEAERTEREKAAMLIATSGSTIEGPHNFRHFQQVTSRDETSNMNSYCTAPPPVAPDYAPTVWPETSIQPSDIAWSQSTNYQHTPSIQTQPWHHGQYNAFYSDPSYRGYEWGEHTHNLQQMHPHPGHSYHYRNDYPGNIYSHAYQNVDPNDHHYYGSNNNYPPMEYSTSSETGPKIEEKQTPHHCSSNNWSQHKSTSEVMHVSDDHPDPRSHPSFSTHTYQNYHSNGFVKH